MHSVCVFLGSNPGNSPAYVQAARDLGAELARRGLVTVYGGSNAGCMGVLADAALAAGGRVLGIIPEALRKKEVAHPGLSELRVVGSMHERKALMAELSDAFIALPGGLGTLEELCEVLTWAQLGFHTKPCGLLNVNGYYEPMKASIQQMADKGFLAQQYADMLVYADDTAAALEAFRAYVAPPPKWGVAPVEQRY